MFGSAESEHPRLTNVTDGRTDRRTDRRHAIASASRGKKSAVRKHAATPRMNLFCCGGKGGGVGPMHEQL